jgi:hypothetical protein
MRWINTRLLARGSYCSGRGANGDIWPDMALCKGLFSDSRG